MTDATSAAEPANTAASWPALAYEEQFWDSKSLATFGPAATRVSQHRRTYKSSVPPMIAGLNPVASQEAEELAREAEFALRDFDSVHGKRMQQFAPILLRSEAAASSQIENLSASARQIFTAEVGGKGKRNASQIVANTRSMEVAIRLADDISIDSIRKMHRVLMYDEPRHTPGELRTEAVWIGRNAESPIDAVFVAPAHERLNGLLEDMCSFAQRGDVNSLNQIAVTHAQFETIHPFTDGNGRTGRALAQSMLRRRKLTRNVAVPVSAGLLVNVASYHDALTAYREGDVTPIIQSFAVAALRAIPNGQKLIADIDEVKERWHSIIKPRAKSAKAQIFAYALKRPVFTAEMAAEHAGIAVQNVYRDLKSMQDQGYLTISVEHQGPTIWRQADVLKAMDEFAKRAGKRTL
ncbi:MAG: Fic family protein [Leucobacter sp.]|nr:Fic family protein [Leucobacter sp.]